MCANDNIFQISLKRCNVIMSLKDIMSHFCHITNWKQMNLACKYTTVQKFGSVKIVLKEIKAFIEQGCIQLIKSSSNTFYLKTNVVQRILKKMFPQTNQAVQLFSTLIIIRHFSLINILKIILKDHMTLKTDVNGCWKFCFSITRINNILKELIFK